MRRRARRHASILQILSPGVFPPRALRHTKNFADLFEIVHLRAALDEMANCFVGALDRFGDLVNILRLDDSLEIVLQDLGEVVCTASIHVSRRTRLCPYSAVRIRGSTSRSLPSPADYHRDRDWA